MLLHAAIGDAYGAGFEFEKPDIIAVENTLASYKTHPLYTEIKGRYTDDTQMALSIAELMLSGEEWTPERVADGFVKAFRRDPRRGYSSRFYDVLLQVNSGNELLKVLQPNSERNGAAMRAYPIGLYSDRKEVLAKAALQAQITHDTPAGVASAQAVALTAHYLVYNLGPKQHLGEFLVDELNGGNWNLPWQSEVTMFAEQAVRAAITLIQSESTLSNILKKGISLGGDVDTVGAISLGCASQCQEILNDLPEWMGRELENGPYGKEYIVGLDRDLRLLFLEGSLEKNQERS